MASRVQTVRGDVSPSVLGRTLTHEHLSMDFSHMYRKPPEHLADKFTEFHLNNVGYIRQYPYSSRDNLVFNDQAANTAVWYDVGEYKKFGGGTIVENSTVGLNRDLKFCKEVSKKFDVHVVVGTGHYIADMQANNWLHCTQEELYDHMVKELMEGCMDDPEIKAGVMGEIASVWPIRDFERKAIKAAGEAQSQLKCGVSFHPHRVEEAPTEIMRLYLEAGGAAHKAVMSHLDRTLVDEEKLLEFSELGSYCQFDLFGVEVSYYQLNVTTDMLNDSQRIAMISKLVSEGKTDRILMSHDIHTKHRLIQYGGHGYAHIINNVLPRMKSKGLSEATIDQITITNPAEWLVMQA